MTLPILLIILGFIFLIKGANWMINGSTLLAKKYNISDLVIGLTIVAFGTSAPELVVNIIASSEAHSDIVLGNVIGSNNFNLFVILGIVGLIYPIAVQSTMVKNEIPISLLAAVIFLLLSTNFYSGSNGISRIDGLLLLSLFAGFLFYIYKQMTKEKVQSEVVVSSTSNKKIWLLICIGLLALIIGGKLVVDNAVELATSLGVSQKMIGLTIIAAGTSLPELVTSVVAAFKKNSDIAIGNIIGSNIFNILLVLAISSIIHPIDYNTNFNPSLYFLIGGTLFLLVAMFTGKKLKLDRWEAAILLFAFVLFTVYVISKEIN
ncbi:Inner membrane protein YrbG [Kordia antarctica]|uniref:Inner membrane protein YrbG n=1 Tax=Kordia antarctica TaxID=1218801 RepID=A0A7L4ZT27_9FLAO|nr:calcium/sodium antiporter [Kordia antarctica]QHI39126.1 Inner membrane protein YrbG [Kordia antarctica]